MAGRRVAMPALETERTVFTVCRAAVPVHRDTGTYLPGTVLTAALAFVSAFAASLRLIKRARQDFPLEPPEVPKLVGRQSPAPLRCALHARLTA